LAVNSCPCLYIIHVKLSLGSTLCQKCGELKGLDDILEGTKDRALGDHMRQGVENVNNGVATVSSPLQQKAYCSNDKHRRARPVQQSQMHSNLTFT